MNPLHVVILAAGQGSRMKSALPKVLHPVAGKPMLHHVVDTAKQLGAEKIHTVIGHGADQVRASLHDDSVNWVLQQPGPADRGYGQPPRLWPDCP